MAKVDYTAIAGNGTKPYEVLLAELAEVRNEILK